MTVQALDQKPLALVIEDDNRQATVFAQALRMADFETEIIQNGREALNRLSEVVPALVVLDLHLPEVAGKDIFEQIKADERLVKTRVMLATADPLLAESLRAEVNLVLLKPISFNQLRDLASRFRPR
jgi:CheY-like chemotaxis protein